MRSLLDPILALAYPQPCQSCGRSVEESAGGIACRDCWNSVREFPGQFALCSKCGNYLGERCPATPVYCHHCDDHFYDAAYSAGAYEYAFEASVVHLKRFPELPKPARIKLLRCFNAAPLRHVTLILPVPLSAKRRIERGFNQAEILADVIARASGCALMTNVIERGLHTPMHRAGMDRKARALTVRKAFRVVRADAVEGQHILLVDDVLTSGATVSACAEVLKKSGAASVNVLTLARAI